jgi:hypothetical protein
MPTADAQLRQRILTRALETLRLVGPLSARDLATRLTPLSPQVTHHLINSVLFREGTGHVRHDPATGRFRAR